MKQTLLILALVCIPYHAFSAVSEVTRILTIKDGSVMVTITPARTGSKIDVSTLCPSRLFMTDSGGSIPTLWANILVKKLTACEGCSLAISSFPQPARSCDALFPSLKKDMTISVPESLSFRWTTRLLAKEALESAYEAVWCNVGFWLFSGSSRDSLVASTMGTTGAINPRHGNGSAVGGISIRDFRGFSKISYNSNLADPVISIFDINGNLVRRISAKRSSAIWNKRDESGKAVAPGIYAVTVADKETRYKSTHRFFVSNP